MRIWRLCRRRFARSPLNGRGGLLVSGRWHRRGHRVVYASATLSLATLEVLVHVDRDLLPDDLVSLEIEVPEGLALEGLDPARLPGGWRDLPAPPATKAAGTEWLESGRTALLRVPSVVIPEESNYLLNPLHEDAAGVRVVRRRDFTLDPRLLS